MPFPFRKKAKKKASVPPVAELPPDNIVKEDATGNSMDIKAAILELLDSVVQVPSPGGEEVKLLGSAFSRASRAVLDDPTLVDEKTVGAFVSYSRKIGNTDLREYAVSRLGAIAVKYPEHADDIIAALVNFVEDSSADIRHAAIFSIGDIGRAHNDKAAIVLDILSGAASSAYADLRTSAIIGITALAVLYEEHAEKSVDVLSRVLARKPAGDPALQAYAARIKAAQSLGEIALERKSILEQALEGLAVGLFDDDIFVQHRSIDALQALGLRHEEKKDVIISLLEKAMGGAVFTVKEKAGSAVFSLRPPVHTERTPEEIADERKRTQEQEDRAAFAAWKKQESDRQKIQAEREKKQQMEGIKKLANALPIAKL